MRSVKRIIYKGIISALVLFICFHLSAQENSPFSRYGLGDIYPSQNIITRGMGGLSAAYSHDQALNTDNPASYSALRFVNVYGGSNGAYVTYDFGLTIDARTLRSAIPSASYKSTNFIPSYIQFGVPLSAKSYFKKRGAGLVFGLKPATRINYSVSDIQRTSIDSIETLYEGEGGLTKAFIGLAKRWNNFSIGFNAGYEFGRKETSTKIIFLNDSVHYYKSNSSSTTNFHGFFLTPGISYSIKLSETEIKNKNYKEAYFLTLGASGTMEQKLNASNDIRKETFDYNDNTGPTTIDSVYEAKDLGGHITVPLTYNAGFLLSKKYVAPGAGDIFFTKWAIGADYSSGKWTDYRYYNQPDQLINNSIIRVGGEFTPSLLSTNLWNRSTYRIGFYTGKDYINADGNENKVKAVTFGFGFNLRRWNSYDKQSTMINTAIEFGKRGSSVNNVTENFFRLSLGLSLADLWFSRRKYD
jgi:hypothetical protein